MESASGLDVLARAVVEVHEKRTLMEAELDSLPSWRFRRRRRLKRRLERRRQQEQELLRVVRQR